MATLGHTTSSAPKRRANRVDERIAAGVAGAAGGLAALSGASPTGNAVVDIALVVASVGLVVFAAASCGWWTTVVAAGAALALAGGQPVLTVAAIAALALGLVVGSRRRNMPMLRAVSVGLSCNVIVRGDVRWAFGASAVIGIAAGVFVLVAGIRRRPRHVRRVMWWVLGTTAALATLAVIAFGFALLQARRDLEAGRRSVDAAIDAFDAGDIDTAAAYFAAAGGALDDAHDVLAGPLGTGAMAIPVLGQHREVGIDVTSAAAAATLRVAGSLGAIDLESLQVSAGTIDVAAVRALGAPFAEVDAALQELDVTLGAERSPWLASPVGRELDDLRDRIARTTPQISTARRAVALAPVMLGGDGPRRYLVLFTTPAEARGLGGFVGNYAELTFDGGRASMTAFGRVRDLERQAVEIGARVTEPAGFLDRYGDYGYDEDGGGLVGEASFRNVTMSPHFPWVGQVSADLYEQVTGRHADGVMAMDPYTLAAMLKYTGGVELATLGTTVTADNAATFLLHDQYVLADGRTERVDALEDAARATIDALLATSLPDPIDLAADLRTLRNDRRLLVWTTDGSERDLLRDVGLLGEVPALSGADGWSFTVNNSSGSKIDTFLQRGAGYTSTTDPTTGITTGRLEVELTNSAPASGLPAYVIGNQVGLPEGTSQLLVSVYSPLAATSITVDGVTVDIAASREQEWNVFTTMVDIAPGATASMVVELDGQLARPDELVTWTQPLTNALGPLG